MATLDLSSLNPWLESLMGHYNTVMGLQEKRLAAVPTREQQAFAEWQRAKDLEFERGEQAKEVTARQEEDRRRQLERENRLSDQARLKATSDERTRRLASVDRARTQANTQMTATPFAPEGAIADYYEYGAGNPQGRGGGGSAGGGHVSDSVGGVGSPEWGAMDLRNCMNNPTGPGCPEMLTKAMANGGF